MKIAWAESARLDLGEITDYHSHRAPVFLDRLLTAIDEALVRLLENPRSGQEVAFHPLRKVRLKPGKYLLIYRTTPTGIEVARVVHGGRDWYTGL